MNVWQFGTNDETERTTTRPDIDKPDRNENPTGRVEAWSLEEPDSPSTRFQERVAFRHQELVTVPSAAEWPGACTLCTLCTLCTV